MKRYGYEERDYDFGQLIQTLRSTIGLTQEGLGERLGVSRRAVAEWEGGLSYPKAERLKQLIALAVQQQALPAGREEEQIRALWKAAHVKVLLDEDWLAGLLAPAAPLVAQPAAPRRSDLVGAMDVSQFTGREVEVAELTQWIVQDRCRLVSVLGMGGIGKSTLASYMAVQLAPQFEAVVWRSVRDAPTCEELLADCITALSETPPTSFPASLEQRISLLVVCLQAHRCLLILDNLESLLAEGSREGEYLPGYANYGRLLQRLGGSAHQSCVLLTSREKPREVGPLEGARSPVRTLRLVGLDQQASQALLADKDLSGTQDGWQQLVGRYAGNPLALKIVGEVVMDLFGGDIDRFLVEGEPIFNGIRPLLRQQVGRLSPLEHLLLTWLAVLREWTALGDLLAVLQQRVLRAQLLEALEALGRRSLVARGREASFGLQSVVMEYLTDELTEQLSAEIVQGTPQWLRQVALEQASARDYVRETQTRLLVQPLVQRLRSELGTDRAIEKQLGSLLAQFRSEDEAVQGYGPANVISLLKGLRGHLQGQDLSRLAIRDAYLQGVEMQDATLAGAMLRGTIFTGAFDAVLSLAVSPDGRFIAAGSTSGQVRVWREQGLVLHLTIRPHTDYVTAIAFTSDGQGLLTARLDGTIKLWEGESGALIWTTGKHTIPVTSLVVSQSGKLASGSSDGTIHFWDLRTGMPLAYLHASGGRITALAFSLDGTLLASGSQDGIIRLWDSEQRTLLRELHGHANFVCALAFAPDGSLLASGSLDQTVKLWDPQMGTNRRTLSGHTNVVTGLSWAPDGRLLVSVSHDGTLRFWEAATGQCRHLLQGHRDGVTSVAFLPSGERLLSGGFDRTLRLWDAHSGQSLRTVQGYAQALYALTFSPDGRFLVTGSGECTLTLWEVSSRKRVRVLHGHRQLVFSIAWSRVGNRIASGSADHTIRIWDSETGACTQILQGHTGSVLSVEWSPDGTLLASSGADGSVRLWDLPSGTSHLIGELLRAVNAVAWSPDGALLASGGDDGMLHIWHMTDGALLRRLEHRMYVIALCWNSNGEQVVSASADGERGVLTIWYAEQGTLLRAVEGHTGFIRGVDWSAQDHVLVSVDSDGTLRWWDPVQGVQLARVQAHEAWARAARISPDGQTVASCGEDGVIKLWDMHSHQLLATLRADRPYERLDISGTRGLTNAQQAALRALGAVGAEQAAPLF